MFSTHRRFTNTKLRSRVAFAVLSLGLIVSACGSSENSAERIPQPDLSSMAHFSRVVVPSSLEDLSRQSQLIAVVEPTGKVDVEYVEDVPFDVIEMRVIETISGKPSSDTIRVRLGLPLTDREGKTSQVLSTKTDFLLYLSDFMFEPGKPIGQYIPTAWPSGIFMNLEPGATNQSFVRLDDEVEALPEKVSVDEARSVAEAAGD